MMLTNLSKIKQRADLTYKFNRELGRHGWLRLTPAYSVKIVEQILDNIDSGSRIIDPFSGTATTPLCASYRNYKATGLDINPFLVWFGRLKTRIYDTETISNTINVSQSIVKLSSTNEIDIKNPPPIHNIERWWDSEALKFLCSIKSAIEYLNPSESPVKELLLVAFCRVLIKLSNAAFNHQSMSFKDNGSNQLNLLSDGIEYDKIFLNELETVINSAKLNPFIPAKLILADSIDVADCVSDSFDILITSPPYPNRISYIRELRPYMYWLDYLKDARQAGELDWKAIGGTWGIATSRLSDWERNPNGFYPNYLDKLLSQIASSENKSGYLLSNYIAKYFEDIWNHFKSVSKVLVDGAEVHYIIGNSVFYNVLVPVEQIYKDMLEELGFTNVNISIVRKRNSKKELFEFDVNGHFKG